MKWVYFFCKACSMRISSQGFFGDSKFPLKRKLSEIRLRRVRRHRRPRAIWAVIHRRCENDGRRAAAIVVNYRTAHALTLREVAWNAHQLSIKISERISHSNPRLSPCFPGEHCAWKKVDHSSSFTRARHNYFGFGDCILKVMLPVVDMKFHMTRFTHDYHGHQVAPNLSQFSATLWFRSQLVRRMPIFCGLCLFGHSCHTSVTSGEAVVVQWQNCIYEQNHVLRASLKPNVFSIWSRQLCFRLFLVSAFEIVSRCYFNHWFSQRNQNSATELSDFISGGRPTAVRE